MLRKTRTDGKEIRGTWDGVLEKNVMDSKEARKNSWSREPGNVLLSRDIALTLWRNEGNWKAMNATPGPILPKICDWMLNKNYESHTRSQTIGNRFQFPSFRHRVKAITRESRTLPRTKGWFGYLRARTLVNSDDGYRVNIVNKRDHSREPHHARSRLDLHSFSKQWEEKDQLIL